MPNGSDSSSYDLFLSYNSADHALVEEIARKIRDEHLEPFLDRWYLLPGARWRPRLEQILGSCKAVAVFVGPGEMGRWQQRELDVALDLQANCPSFPVIPVLLPGCEPPLGFLRQLTWVDLRNQALDQVIVILAKAARGEPPGPDLERAFDSIRALEFVLKELWDNRHGGILLNETYDAKGGLQGAVAAKADELFKRLSSAEQKLLQRIFLRIVRPSAESTLDTRRRAAFTELPPEGKELVGKLTDERLLVTNQSASGLEQTVEVAHEALISNWSTLRAWVNEDREFLLWRDRLGPLLKEWERAQQTDEAVLRGPLLIEAQKWFDERSQDLSDQERKFISAGREQRERLAREEKERQQCKLAEAEERRQGQAAAAKSLRRLAGVLVVVAIIAVGGAIFGFWQKNEAEIRKVLRRLRTRRPSGRKQSLRRMLTKRKFRGMQPRSRPGLLSPNNRWVVTGSWDNTARLWDLSAEDPTASPVVLRGHDGAINAVAISPDNRWVVTGSNDNTARLWDLNAKDPAANPIVLRGHHGGVTAVAISPDNRWVVTGSADKTARLWLLQINDLVDLARITAGPKFFP